MKKIILVVFSLLCLGICAVNAQYTVLVNFDGANNPKGTNPYGSLTRVGNKFYGMTSVGGAHNDGVIFSVDTNGGGYKDLFDFAGGANGANPWGNLIISGKVLYGMTEGGGIHNDGNVFSIDTDGTAYKDLLDFNGANGKYPYGSLTRIGKTLYGLTGNGGIHSLGNLFSLDTNGGGYRDLYDCNGGGSGELPNGTLIQAGNKFYAMTYFGGSNFEGNLFSIDTDGHAYNNLLNFGSFVGEYPYADLMLSGRELYGMTSAGGAHSDGNIFHIDTNGFGYMDLHDFSGGALDGSGPEGDLVLSGGVMYGMSEYGGTSNDGVLFSLDTTGSGYFDIVNFGPAKGTWPLGNVTISGNELYGMASGGGANSDGVIFTLCALGVTSGVINPVSCFGGSNGSAKANTNIGILPYTYSWAPIGGTADTASGLSAGTYTVTVTNNNGCTATAAVTITQPSLFTGVSLNVVSNVSCFGGNNGSISSALTGGAAPFTYLWTPTAESSATATGLSTGTYTLTVNDACGVTLTASATITQPTAVSITIASFVNSGGCTPTGSITANAATGGTSPYTYQWSPSGGTNLVASALSGGTYTITATDNNGCTASASATITQPVVVSISIASQTNVNCNGGTGSITANPAAGGTTPYTYSWSGSGGTNLTASNLTAGSYTITVTDNHSCTATASATITQPTLLTATIGTMTNVSCNGGDNGNITVVAGGGTLAYHYIWAPVGATSAMATGLAAGCYTVTVTDGNGCTATASACITEPLALTVSANATANILCNGESNGSASSTISGGVTPYTYSWSNSQTTTNISNLSAGTYTLNVTDNNGCTGSASASITQPAPLTLVADAYGFSDTACHGVVYVTAGGGTWPYMYLWASGGQTTDTVKGLCAGKYCCKVTDRNGCMDSACVDIPTGINNITSETNQIKIYPNPNEGIFTVESLNITAHSLVEIYNELGQKIYSHPLELLKGSNSEINISNQPAGIYLYKILNEDSSMIGIGKLIIQK